MRALLAALLILVCQVVVVRAGDAPRDRDTLRGLTAIAADVQPDAVATRLGLAAQPLQKDVELKLHLAGIRAMASPDEDVPPEERGVLSIGVSVVPLPKEPDVYSYAIVVTLLQGVVVIRDPQTVIAAPTWWVAKSGVGGKNQIRSAVLEATEKFVAAFLSVNSKK